MPVSNNDIVDPTLYSDETKLHAILTELRHTDPVRWTQPSDYRPFWALTKHAVAVNNYELRGKWIEAGQSVMMIYPSANRDEEIFEHPQKFNIERTNNGHIAFGIGPHVCLGQALARLEMRHLLKELSNRIKNVELTEPTTWVKNNVLSGPKRMKVKCIFAD